jgi:hypothetical protein
MAKETQKTKLLLELQMEELKASYGIKKEDSDVARPNNARSEANAKIAKLYETAAEYEEELERFEEELEIINTNKLEDIVVALSQKFPNEEGNYAQELKSVLEAGWTHLVEVKQTHPKEQLELIMQTEFSEVLDRLNTTFPTNGGDFEAEVRDIIVKRWESFIAIKKEHIEEEREDIEEYRGLKPDFAKGVYKKYHGIE